MLDDKDDPFVIQPKKASWISDQRKDSKDSFNFNPQHVIPANRYNTAHLPQPGQIQNDVDDNLLHF